MKKTQESGRSMVEMLGVLAIIGVLSIGGIAGYTMAMNRYRANEIIDMANKYAALAFSGNQTLLARNGYGYAEYTSTTGGTTGSTHVPSPKAIGLFAAYTTGTGSTATTNSYKMPSGGEIRIENGGITDGSVKVKMTFPTDGVCQAASNILGGGDCTGATNPYFTHEFRQS